MTHSGDWTVTEDGAGLAIEAVGEAYATGGNATASVTLSASIEDDATQTTGEVWIMAEAEVDAGIDASVAAETDARAEGDDVEVVEERSDTETGGDRLTAISLTHLRATMLNDYSDWADPHDGWIAARWSAWVDDWLA